MSIDNLRDALSFMTDNFLYDLVVYICDRQHGNAGVTGAVRCVVDVENLNEWRPVRIKIIPVCEMFAVRSSEQVFTIIEVILVFKERENLVSNRNNADSGSSFRMNNIEIVFIKVDVFFLEVEEFRDSASGI